MPNVRRKRLVVCSTETVMAENCPTAPQLFLPIGFALPPVPPGRTSLTRPRERGDPRRTPPTPRMATTTNGNVDGDAHAVASENCAPCAKVRCMEVHLKCKLRGCAFRSSPGRVHPQVRACARAVRACYGSGKSCCAVLPPYIARPTASRRVKLSSWQT